MKRLAGLWPIYKTPWKKNENEETEAANVPIQQLTL